MTSAVVITNIYCIRSRGSTPVTWARSALRLDNVLSLRAHTTNSRLLARRYNGTQQNITQWDSWYRSCIGVMMYSAPMQYSCPQRSAILLTSDMSTSWKQC